MIIVISWLPGFLIELYDRIFLLTIYTSANHLHCNILFIQGRRMVMKILGIIGSPRKNGNTHVLVSKILEGATKAGVAAEMIFLNDLTIRECDGCHVCWTGKPCCKKDDMIALYERIIASDVIVFGTPVYWFGPTALMKGFIDRFVYFNCPENRAKIKGKSAVIVVPYEEENAETGDFMARFFEKCFGYLEIPLIGKIIVPGVTERGEVINKSDVMKMAFELGAKIAICE